MTLRQQVTGTIYRYLEYINVSHFLDLATVKLKKSNLRCIEEVCKSANDSIQQPILDPNIPRPRVSEAFDPRKHFNYFEYMYLPFVLALTY